MDRPCHHGLARLALSLLAIVAFLLVAADAQELKPKGKVAVKKVLPGGFAFSPDGRSLAVTGTTGDFNFDDQALAAGSLNFNMSNTAHVVLLVEAGTGKVKRQLMKAPEKGMSGLFGGGDPIAFSADGRLLMAVYGNAIHVWEAEKGKKLGVWGKDLQNVVFSHDRRFALVKHSDDTYETLDLKDGHSLGSFKGDTEGSLVLSEPERPSIVYLKEQNAILRNLSTGDETSLGPVAGERIIATAISPNGGLLAVGTDTFNLAVWNLNENKKVFERSAEGKSGAGNPIFSPDGSVLVYIWKDLLTAHSLADNSESSIAHEHLWGIGDIVFADAHTLATRGTLVDTIIKLWSLSPESDDAAAPGPAPAAVPPVLPPQDPPRTSPSASWASWGILGVQRHAAAYTGMSPGPSLSPGHIYLAVALQLVNASGAEVEFKYPHSGLFLHQISSGQSIQARDITNEALRKEVEKFRQQGLFQNLAKDFVFSVNFQIKPGEKEEFSLLFEVPESSPDNDFELCLPDTQSRPLTDIRPVAVVSRPIISQVASVEGTTWDTEDSTGQREAYEFQKGGRLVQYTANGRFPNGTWTQDGGRLSFEVNEGYVSFEAQIEGDQLKGTAKSRFGQDWTFTAIRRSGSKSGTVPMTGKPTAPDGSRDGLSFTLDRSGKLTAVDGISIKGRQEWEDLARRVVRLHEQAKFSEARPLAEKALKVAEENFGPQDVHTAISLNSLAVICNAQNNFDAALPLALRSVALYEKIEGHDAEAVSDPLNTLGMTYSGQEKYVEAEEAFTRAIALAEKGKRTKDDTLGTIYNNLGQAYSSQDRLDEAEIAYQRALEILEESLGPRDQRIAFTLNNLAYVKKEKNDVDGALALYRRSLDILESSAGKDHPRVADVLANLAVVYELKGMNKEAQEAIQRAQRIRSKR